MDGKDKMTRREREISKERREKGMDKLTQRRDVRWRWKRQDGKEGKGREN